MQYVSKVGVELEGGWNTDFEDDDPTELHADHSVRVTAQHVGEAVSKPLSLEEVLEWTDKHYPDVMDASCGLHIHTSVKNDSLYAALAESPLFYLRFLKWGKAFLDGLEGAEHTLLMNRLSGANRFCAMKFVPQRQIPLKTKGGGNTIDTNPRYAQLNFAKGVHGTIENRTFPIFTKKKIALKAIEGYVNLMEEFLSEKKGHEVFKIKRTF